MIRRALAWLGTTRVLALLGLIVIVTTAGYWWHVEALFPDARLSYSGPFTGCMCCAGLAEDLDRVVILDRPYTLTLGASNHKGWPAPPLCTMTAAVSAPQFEVRPAEAQSVDLAQGESASLTWTLIPRQAGMHTVTVDWPGGKESAYHLEWRVGVTDSAFERMVGLPPRQIQVIGWVLGVGLLLPYFLAPFYRVLRGRAAFPSRSRIPE